MYGNWPHKYGGNGPADADQFHKLILDDELARSSGGIVGAVWTPISIALPPILHHGSEEMRMRVAPDVIRGEKLICLAITEPQAGSDVAGVQTTAVRNSEGSFVVNGHKKFITGGGYADFFVVLCRTGGPGMSGLTVLLLEKTMPGITTRRIPTMGWWTSCELFF